MAFAVRAMRAVVQTKSVVAVADAVAGAAGAAKRPASSPFNFAFGAAVASHAGMGVGMGEGMGAGVVTSHDARARIAAAVASQRSKGLRSRRLQCPSPPSALAAALAAALPPALACP